MIFQTSSEVSVILIKKIGNVRISTSSVVCCLDRVSCLVSSSRGQSRSRAYEKD
jgi:hypothetical protein